tara:strand:- start:1476 stop:1688 length:213 start_codon:yes stop_codon:yes gene_type:complete
MEKLDINNIIETQEIKNLIRHKKELLEFFDELIKKINKRINEEKPVITFNIEIDEDIILSDHSSDELEDG